MHLAHLHWDSLLFIGMIRFVLKFHKITVETQVVSCVLRPSPSLPPPKLNARKPLSQDLPRGEPGPEI